MLHLHRAERADGLVAALAGLMIVPLGDPFAPEVVAVPTRGMERWLTQQLSAWLGATPGHQDGVCANVAFPSPGRLVGEAVAAAAGIDPDADPWVPERSVWPLLEVVDAHLHEPWLATLAAHLGATDDDGSGNHKRHRRFATVRRLADLFARYALYRPDMVLAWARGETGFDDPARTGQPPTPDHSHGHADQPPPPDHADQSPEPTRATPTPPPDAIWQAELWRRLADHIGQPDPAGRLARACARLREDPDLIALPPRLSIFGLTRLPAGHLEVLRALAAKRDVHLFLLHPSPVLWERVASAIEGRPPIRIRAQDPTATLPTNPLLASWGHDARELQLVLAPGHEAIDHHHPTELGPAGQESGTSPAAEHTPTLLSRIQADVRNDAAPPGPPLPGQPDARMPLDPNDRSIEVHSCHGRARQVEVLRDAILHLLAEDPALEPRDVIVMCPDIESFAPLIHATFGTGTSAPAEGDEDPAVPDTDETGTPTTLRVRLADRSLRQTNPILGVVAALLELADARVTASAVLDLADREPVRRRFRLDDDDITRLERWIGGTGIRWGFDAEHRAPFMLDKVEAGTWRAGLDRLLVGVTMTEERQRLFEGVLPLDDVESGSIDLAGRLAELIDRLQAALDSLRGPQTIDRWAEAIGDAADMLAATTEVEGWQRAELRRLLDDMVRDAATADGEVNRTELALPEIRALLGARLQGRPTRVNFRTGHLTICTLMPMRSVPHRVVCLLGMDDGVFPRTSPRDGDDLTLHEPHVGDGDARTEDRQLLLDALLAATDKLIIAFTGNDERTNIVRPPAVPVGELLDVVDRTARIADGDDANTKEKEEAASERVLIRHPLQPFDPRNFIEGEFVPSRPWSFDRAALEGALALTRTREEPQPFLPAPLPPRATPLIELEDLTRFVRHPIRAFLRQRLGVQVGDFSNEIEDALPVELDHLQTWEVGSRLLEARRNGVTAQAAIDAELARGLLPPGALADRVIARVQPSVELILQCVEEALGGDHRPASVDVRVGLPDGRLIGGTVPGVCGDLLLTATYARVNPAHRLETWVRWLALTAAHPEREFRAATIGRAQRDADYHARVTVAGIAPLSGDPETRRARALAYLAVLVDLYDRALREPVPLFAKTSAAFAHAIAAGNSGEAAARKAWKSEWNFRGEDADPEHELVYGPGHPFAELFAAQPREDETGDGWFDLEPSRLGRYALRLWAGPLECEQVVDR